MSTIKKWSVKYYIWIMLGFSILGMGFACVSIFEAYKLIVLKDEPMVQKTFRIISKPKEEIPKNRDIREEVKISIDSGDTVEMIGQELDDKGIISKDELFNYLNKNKINLEGITFQGEYSLPISAAPKEVIDILDGPYERWIQNEYNKNKKKTKSPLEIITIASMIEKEAAMDSERPIIAGVIYNRLKNNMKLQIDATVIYALGQHKSRLSYEDLKINSPYNTYIIDGLPPTPICVPGEKSIEAALNPDSNPYLYYVVSAYGSQNHAFSKTYEQHLENVAKYKASLE